MTDLAHTSPAARRYARALFLAARDSGALEAVSRDVDMIRHATGHPEVSGWLADPRVDDSKKQALLERELGARAHELTRGLLRVIGERGRQAILPELPAAFQELIDELAGRQRGVVESARALSEEQREALQNAMAAKTGKEVILTPTVNESLLGGVRVTLAGTRYDGTLEARLASMRRTLLAADLGDR